jgi:ferredoxin
MSFVKILLAVFWLCLFILFAGFSFVSWREKHCRAARLGLLFACLSLVLGIALYFAPQGSLIVFAAILGSAVLISVLLFIWPSTKVIQPSPPPAARVDERKIMFARARLVPGTERYTNYYLHHPEHQAPDDRFRHNPGLLQLGSAFYEPRLAAITEGGFRLTEALRDAVDGPVSSKMVSSNQDQFTLWVKRLALYYGAVDVGICVLQPYHIYSHIGRGSGTYGAKVDLSHHFAIAFTVEMSHEIVNTAPKMPAVVESARQYVEAAKIAVILAAAIREMGYPARAHIDGNYRVIAPLVAKDAGLGEIGRMGILMTPKLGPRVRLGVVTTDLPLITDQPTWDPTVIDFCTLCQKCAEVCPSQAIPFGEREKYKDSTLRWKINPERCYTYWTKVGTDCGRCMAVCPYAHANNIMHNLIRFGVARSANFRRAAYAMDNFFYGKKPAPHSAPDWLKD